MRSFPSCKICPTKHSCKIWYTDLFFRSFYYPRSFLTAHFWTPQQRSEFQSYYMKRRLCNNKDVFRCLQAKLKATASHPKHSAFADILGQLGSGTHPTPEMLIDVKDIFAEGPYSLLGMSRKHVVRLI